MSVFVQRKAPNSAIIMAGLMIKLKEFFYDVTKIFRKVPGHSHENDKHRPLSTTAVHTAFIHCIIPSDTFTHSN